MQLKIKRSQRDGGLIGRTVIFCVDARVEFDPVERQNLVRYKLHNQVIYNSEASKRNLARSEAAAAADTMMGNVKSLAFVAMAAMNLNISITSLERGQHIECKSLDELLGAEEALMEACRNLKAYLDTAATFDGREILLDYANGEGELIAHSVAPQPMLVQAPPPVAAPQLAFAGAAVADDLPPAPTPIEYDDRFGYASLSPTVADPMAEDDGPVDWSNYTPAFQERPKTATRPSAADENASGMRSPMVIAAVVAALFILTFIFSNHS